MTVDGATPLLSPTVIRKLAKYIGQVTRPNKRFRLSARETAAIGGATPRGKGRMADLDTAILSRILKILDRSVRVGEDLDPFQYMAPVSDRNASPRKPKKAGKRIKTTEGDEPEEEIGKADVPADEPPPVHEVTEADEERLTKILEIAKDSVLAADCCIALLASDRLTKQASFLSIDYKCHADA